jgi:deoxyribodipyrimidine photo-lyase
MKKTKAEGQTAIWWIRRDVRLRDNRALAAALARAETVVPVFILDPNVLNSRYHRNAELRKAFLFGALRNLDKNLRRKGSRLLVRRGKPEEALARLCAEVNAETVYAEEDFSPYARQRDTAVAARAPLMLTHGLAVHHPIAMRKNDGTPYTTFAGFSRAWKALPLPQERDLIPMPRHLPSPPELRSTRLPKLHAELRFPPSESEGLLRLRRFTKGSRAPIYGYARHKNRLDLERTSALSPYFRFGLISTREAIVRAIKAESRSQSEAERQGVQGWLNELIWRDFHLSILFHFPYVLDQAFAPPLRKIRWRNNDREIDAWRNGQTGYPVVDAAMRQLRGTGWIHNRSRMIVASFLTKNLLADWRVGERWFMQNLIDGDLAANNGGWQWTAGVGTDAAPYFRVFNPILQGRKFDPKGEMIRRWIPELTQVPNKLVHTPWKMRSTRHGPTKNMPPVSYPRPIVELGTTRRRALASYRSALRNRPTRMNDSTSYRQIV